MFIYPYRTGSNSARALADCLQARVIRRENSRFVGGPKKVVINWGSSELTPEINKCRVVNKIENVKIAGNKLLTFQKLAGSGVSIPWFTTSQDAVIIALEKGVTFVARKSLTGHSGVGIEILEKGLDFVEAPLYTKYIPKDREYRLHVVGGKVVDVQRKIKDPSRDVTCWKVRSHANGFIFVRNNDEGKPYKDLLEEGVESNALLAVTTLGLDFAAVDVIFNKKQNKAFVLELNCAPGLEGSTVETYTEALKQYA